MICCICHKEAALILDTCAECDPELHNAWNAAVKSVIDWDTITPEMLRAFELLEKRKLQGRGSRNPDGFIQPEGNEFTI
jgi:hypothetical protein